MPQNLSGLRLATSSSADLVSFTTGATLSLAYRGSLDPGHILYELLTGPPDGYRERLKSRRPFVPAARKLLQDLTELDIRAA